MIRWCMFLLCLGLVVTAEAHPLAPALLELREMAPARHAVLWRTSVARVQGVDVSPVLPPDCVNLGPVKTETAENDSLVAIWEVQCGDAGIIGKTLTVAGLERSGINVIVRIETLRGMVIKGLLDAQHPAFVVPEPAAAGPVFNSYLRLGVEHLLTGFDHVLFVIGLLLLVRQFRPLLVTITAFTLGHSVTLALASIGIVHVHPAFTELGIALSILVLACELVRPREYQRTWLMRKPWLMAGSFGLLHGLGFAGALAQIGLPPREIPLSLFAFNLGIEAGQLLLVTAVTLLAMLRHLRPWHWTPEGGRLARVIPSYFIGILAAFWCIERAAILVTGTS
jgi:hydrogenase/urease accessory protein HupE